jgi:hypothetical protein
VLDIHKKIILERVLQLIAQKGELTGTWLKRYAGKFPEADVLSAIKYGCNAGYLKAGRAKGGVVAGTTPLTVLEADFYDCIEAILRAFYERRAGENGRQLTVKTAKKDTKVAGRWTRPDFTVVTSRAFPYIKQTEFDIITFEAKRPKDVEALAVFEALAHNSAATRSYVVFPITEAELKANVQGDRIREECVRHGIGLFLVRDSYALDEAVLLIEAQPRALNPEKCSHFLQHVLERDELAVITTWPQ